MSLLAVPVLNVPPALPEIAQLPFAILKQPFESWMPFAKVEVAVVLVALMTGMLMAV